MKQFILESPGKAEDLQLVEAPKPKIGDDELLVQLSALSINPVDYKAMASEGSLKLFFGDERPVVLGWDISGKVVEAGSAVTGFKAGDEVFGMVNFPGKGNAYAEYVAVPESHVTAKPSNVSHKEAAAATLAALTAWQVLNGKVKKGDRVLIHGASGGVGHYAVQIAKHFGAYVIGTSSAANKDFVLGLGADEHLDYTTQQFENVFSDLDYVLDTIGGEIIGKSIQATRDGGIIVSLPTRNIDAAYLEKAKLKHIDLSFIMVRSSGTDMKIIADLLSRGVIKSHVSQTYTFEHLQQALKQVETRRTVGKLAVTF